MAELGPRDEAGRPIFYEAINAGKAVRRMDLKDPSQKRHFLRLVEQADVLLEAFRPGVMERLGLGYATLSVVNPRLVYCALSGYGALGPCAQDAGHDANYLALAGILHRNGANPNYFDPPVADCTGGLFAVITVLAALRARDRNGRGCAIDIGLADVLGPFQTFHIADYGKRGYSPSPNETYLNGGAAYYRVYRTLDSRHVVLGAVEQQFWDKFCLAADRPEWAGRNREPIPQNKLIADLESLFASHTLAEWMARFGPADCCVTPVLTLSEALESEHCRRRDLVRRSPAGDLQALFPAWIDGMPPLSRPPVRLTTAGFEDNAGD